MKIKKEHYMKKLRPLLDKAGIWALIGVVVGSMLTYFFSLQLTKYESKQETIEVASIIYFDLEKSIDALNVQEISEEQVLKNKFTNLSNEYQSLIIKLRKNLSNEEINRLFTYYSNLSYLELKRLNYWEDSNSQNSISEYQDTFNLINFASYEQLNITDLLEKIKKIADIN